MKSGIVLVLILFINLSFINPGKSEEVYGNAELTTENSTLIFNITLYNNSLNQIFIPLSYWIFSGDTLGNQEIFPYQTYFVNKIEYLKSKYDHFESWIDGAFSRDFLKKIPSFKIVNPYDSSSFKIKVEISSNLLDKFCLDTYNFVLHLSYGDDESLLDIGEVINCPLFQLVDSDVEDDSLTIFINSKKKQIEWYKFNELVDCKLDKKKSKIFSLGFMRKIVINTRLNLPKLNRK